MTKLLPLALALTCFVIMAACQSVTQQQLEKIPPNVRRGVTTTAEVQTLLGEPGHRRISANGETWFYGEVQERETSDVVVDQAIGIGSGFIPVPYIGTAISGIRSIGRSTKSAQPSATIEFDHTGIVRDYVIDIP
jgi:hypothetical protein